MTTKRPRHFSEKYPLVMGMPLETAPLIFIRDGIVQGYANKRDDKAKLLEERIVGDSFYIPMPWKWSTDVFEVTEEDIVDYLAKHNDTSFLSSNEDE